MNMTFQQKSLKSKNMRLRRFLPMLLLLGATACGPSRYTMHLETRQPSRAGVDLAGKNLSVVYLQNPESKEYDFNSYMAEGLAAYLEKDYGTGEGSVGVYRLERNNAGDYASKDTLVNLLVETGADYVFLLDNVRFGEMTVGGPSKVSYPVSADSSIINTASIPFTIKMYGYDAMDKKEEVRSFGGTAMAQPDIYSDGKLTAAQLKAKAYELLPKEGIAAGELVGASFASQWKVEGFSVAYYDSVKWILALQKADNFDWKGAMDIWFEMLESKDVLKRSSAAYNIALSCYMLGDYRLAEQWLDLSDKESELSFAAALRKRINSRK